MNHRLKKNLIAYSFLAPNFLGFAIFTLIPIVFALALAFMNWDGASDATFAGFKNFEQMFKNETFRISTFNTFYYTIGVVPLTLIASLALAILLSNALRGRAVFRAVMFFPYVASLVAVAVVWNMIFHPSMGPVNYMLQALGVTDPPKWTASPDWAMATVIFVSIWKGAGYYMVIYLAALTAIPRHLYEAAEIDGAGKWRQFWKITLPMLTPATFFVVMMLVINCFKVFDLIFVMTGGGPGRATNVLVYHIYTSAFSEFNFGYSSAVALFLFVCVLVITLIQFRMEKKWVSYQE